MTTHIGKRHNAHTQTLLETNKLLVIDGLDTDQLTIYIVPSICVFVCVAYLRLYVCRDEAFILKTWKCGC